MIELKRLVNELAPDRRRVLDDYLRDVRNTEAILEEGGKDHGNQDGSNGGTDTEGPA